MRKLKGAPAKREYPSVIPEGVGGGMDVWGKDMADPIVSNEVGWIFWGKEFGENRGVV